MYKKRIIQSSVIVDPSRHLCYIRFVMTTRRTSGVEVVRGLRSKCYESNATLCYYGVAHCKSIFHKIVFPYALQFYRRSVKRIMCFVVVKCL